MKKIFNIFAIPAIALIGLLVSIELTVVYYNANFVQNAMPSFCAVNDVVNCDTVAKTQFSHFLGIPLSVYGIGFYLMILFLALIENKNFPIFKNPRSYIYSASLFSLFVSASLAWISSHVIQSICILCYVTYVLNIILFIISKPTQSFISPIITTYKDFMSAISDKRLLLFFIGGLILASSILFYTNSSKILVAANTNQINSEYKIKNQQFSVFGDPNPKLIINEYTDFECPFCSMSNDMLHRLVEEVKGVQVIHHDFPLNKDCNPTMQRSIHKNSCTAALYSRAAKKQGKSLLFNDLLFMNQKDLSEKNILNMAKVIHLDINKLKKDAHSLQAIKELKEDAQKAVNLGVEATPTYFIGMKKYEGMMPYPELKKTVLENIKK